MELTAATVRISSLLPWMEFLLKKSWRDYSLIVGYGSIVSSIDRECFTTISRERRVATEREGRIWKGHQVSS